MLDLSVCLKKYLRLFEKEGTVGGAFQKSNHIDQINNSVILLTIQWLYNIYFQLR